jgi:ribosome-associated heat shock protein Hsp15
MDNVRIDKWLWAARFFKTRSEASKARDLGRVSSNGHPAKPARDVCIGDMLNIRNEGGDFEIEVLQLSSIRGPATVAQTLYRETEASRVARQKAAEEREAMMEFGGMPAGRPTKQDRAQNKFRFGGRDWRPIESCLAQYL